MLILTRKKSESFVITAPDGTPLTITVAKTGPVQVRIGIDAPREWIVKRTELLESKDAA